MKFVIVWSIAVTTCFALIAVAGEDAKSPLEVRITNHLGLVGVGRDDNTPDQLYVVVTNVSGAPVRIWDQWNSWGYDSLSFSLRTDNPKTKRELARLGSHSWGQNAPDAIELRPHEQYAIAVYFTDEDEKNQSNSWGPLAVGNGENPWVTIVAHFEIKADDATRSKHVWTGRVSSPPSRIRLKDESERHDAKDELTDANTSK